MSGMLSGFDLIKLEEKLRGEVSEFGTEKWDTKELVGSDSYEMDHRSWRKMVSSGKNTLTRSTRRSMDNKRIWDKETGNGYSGVRL